jgi:hypothetical protein
LGKDGRGEWLKRGQRAVFIDVESGSRPVCVPCLIGGPLNPGGATLYRRLYYKYKISNKNNKIISKIIKIDF